MSKRIPLTRGLHTVVDDEDFDVVGQHKWYAQRIGRPGSYVYYAARSVYVGGGKSRIQYMHRAILGCAEEVDHKSGDTLDNRRTNLRPSDRTQQARNHQRKRKGCSAGHIGIYRTKGGRWVAQVTVAYKNIALGTFDTELQALAARQAAVATHYGEDRVQNGS